MPQDEEAKTALSSKVEEIAFYLERIRFGQYIELFNRPWRLMWLNFLAGLARGVGIAIGGTLLAALVFIMLNKLAILNLPLIGDFIAEVVRIVQGQLAK